MRIGIVCALAAEAGTWPAPHGRFAGAHAYRVHIAGPGQSAAAAAATTLLDQGCDTLLCWGLAGGLDARFAAGALVCADAIIDDAGSRYACDDGLQRVVTDALGAHAPAHTTVLSLPRPLATTQAKHDAGRRSGAGAVEMEAAAMAAIAAARGRPFGAVRAVIDPCGFDLPPAALVGLDAQGGTQLGATLASLLRHPTQLPDLLRLGAWYRRALTALAAAATRLAQ